MIEYLKELYDNHFQKKESFFKDIWYTLIPYPVRDSFGTIYDYFVNFYLPIYYENDLPILIYQMGKVGSKSIFDSLKDYGCKAVFHIHTMNHDYIKIKKIKFESDGPPYGICPNHKMDKVIRKTIIKEKKSLKVITLVREPISRNISAFFQNLDRYVLYDDNKMNLDFLEKSFLKDFDRHDPPFNWFNRELKEILGIDIYQYNFPKNKGYQIIEKKPYELLIMKLEMEDKKMEKAIINFLDLNDDFKLRRSNVGKKKEYAELYQKFKEQVDLPQWYIDKMLDSKYTRHFYTEEEIQEAREKWS